LTEHDEQRNRIARRRCQGVQNSGDALVSSFRHQLTADQLETVLSSLQDDPDNDVLQGLQTELREAISVTQSAIDDLQPHVSVTQHAAAPPPVVEKWSKENHPAFQAGYRRPGAPASFVVEEAPAVTALKVNDTVLAKWVTGDKGFYPARITSITGSSANPVYIVTFKSYGSSETVRGNDIKPIVTDSKKRKADDSPVSSIPLQTARTNTGVISAAASIDPALAQKRKEPSLVSDGHPKPPKAAKKIKANKELEAGKNKWQDFSLKGKLGTVKTKESMFRTGESATARGKIVLDFEAFHITDIHIVGFTGSGQTMRKDPTRSRHIYQENEEDGY